MLTRGNCTGTIWNKARCHRKSQAAPRAILNASNPPLTPSHKPGAGSMPPQPRSFPRVPGRAQCRDHLWACGLSVKGGWGSEDQGGGGPASTPGTSKETVVPTAGRAGSSAPRFSCSQTFTHTCSLSVWHAHSLILHPHWLKPGVLCQYLDLEWLPARWSSGWRGWGCSRDTQESAFWNAWLSPVVSVREKPVLGPGSAPTLWSQLSPPSLSQPQVPCWMTVTVASVRSRAEAGASHCRSTHGGQDPEEARWVLSSFSTDVCWGGKSLSCGRRFCCCCSVAKSRLTLWPHGPQQARLPWPSLSPRVCLSWCSLSQWFYLTISSSVTPPFSSGPQFLPSIRVFSKESANPLTNWAMLL